MSTESHLQLVPPLNETLPTPTFNDQMKEVALRYSGEYAVPTIDDLDSMKLMASQIQVSEAVGQDNVVRAVYTGPEGEALSNALAARTIRISGGHWQLDDAERDTFLQLEQKWSTTSEATDEQMQFLRKAILLSDALNERDVSSMSEQTSISDPEAPATREEARTILETYADYTSVPTVDEFDRIGYVNSQVIVKEKKAEKGTLTYKINGEKISSEEFDRLNELSDSGTWLLDKNVTKHLKDVVNATQIAQLTKVGAKQFSDFVSFRKELAQIDGLAEPNTQELFTLYREYAIDRLILNEALRSRQAVKLGDRIVGLVRTTAPDFLDVSPNRLSLTERLAALQLAEPALAAKPVDKKIKKASTKVAAASAELPKPQSESHSTTTSRTRRIGARTLNWAAKKLNDEGVRD